MTSSNREQIRAVLAEIRAEIQRLQYKQMFKYTGNGAGIGVGPNWAPAYSYGGGTPLNNGGCGGIGSGGQGYVGANRADAIGADIGFDSTD